MRKIRRFRFRANKNILLRIHRDILLALIFHVVRITIESYLVDKLTKKVLKARAYKK